MDWGLVLRIAICSGLIVGFALVAYFFGTEEERLRERETRKQRELLEGIFQGELAAGSWLKHPPGTFYNLPPGSRAMGMWRVGDDADYEWIDPKPDPGWTSPPLQDALPTDPHRSTYQDYLQTPEWRARRQEALRRAGGRCQLCNSAEDLQVHHRTYERLGQEDPEDMTVLCDECHALFHEGGRMPDRD